MTIPLEPTEGSGISWGATSREPLPYAESSKSGKHKALSKKKINSSRDHREVFFKLTKTEIDHLKKHNYSITKIDDPQKIDELLNILPTLIFQTFKLPNKDKSEKNREVLTKLFNRLHDYLNTGTPEVGSSSGSGRESPRKAGVYTKRTSLDSMQDSFATPVQTPQAPKLPSELASPRLQTIQEPYSKIFGGKINKTHGTQAVPQSAEPGRFYNWRSDEPAEITFNPAVIDDTELADLDEFSRDRIIKKCFEDYKSANKSFEQAIGDTALRFVYPVEVPEISGTSGVKGPLLELSQKMSERYLEMLKGYVSYEKSKGRPMLSNAAGQMKNHGFETEEILRMQGSCIKLMEILAELRTTLLSNPSYEKRGTLTPEGQKIYEAMKNILFEKEARKNFSESDAFNEFPGLKSQLTEAIVAYENLDEFQLIDRAFFMMWNFPQLNHEEIEMQLYEVANMKTDARASEDERLLMEIRHRIGGDGSVQQTNPGSVGQNPLAYLNIIREGEPGNPEGEFREQMYFVYMLNNFANTVMLNPELVQFINTELSVEGKGWQIDPNFVHDMNARGPGFLPPIFRYGAYAALNRFIRSKSNDEEKKAFYKNFKIPTLQELIDYCNKFKSSEFNPEDAIESLPGGQTGECSQPSLISHDTAFRHRLTDREMLNQFGVTKVDILNTDQPLQFHAGGAGFHLATPEEIQDKVTDPTLIDPKLAAAIKYINAVVNLGIPVVSGISGTFDQTTAMAGLIGIGLDEIKENRKREQEQLRLAMLAFMIPNSDHSVHEVMQSSVTYGLEYTAGPGFEEQIFPEYKDEFLKILKKEQKLRGFELPSYYLSGEYVGKVREIITTL